MNKFDIEFFELANDIKTLDSNSPNTDSIYKKLLKLNNPTYYGKFHYRHPIEKFGYPAHRTMNPVLLAIANMISIIKNKENVKTQLEVEYSWAYNNITDFLKM